MRNEKGQFVKGNKDGFKIGNTLWDNKKSKKSQFKKGGAGFTGKHTEETKKKIRDKKIGIRVSIDTEFKKGHKRQNGSKGSNWKGGVTPINKIIRRSVKYRLWRETVFERDDYTCWICGERGGVIHPHHLKKFSDYPKLRLIINNGLTLCEFCHKTYTDYGFKKSIF